MTTRMKHPEHGWTHAYDQSEIDRLKAHGWEPEEDPQEVLKEVQEAIQTLKRKPGRPKGS